MLWLGFAELGWPLKTLGKYQYEWVPIKPIREDVSGTQRPTQRKGAQDRKFLCRQNQANMMPRVPEVCSSSTGIHAINPKP